MTKAQLSVNGQTYDGWESLTVRRSIEHIASAFTFDFTDSWTPRGLPFGINPQDEIDVKIAGQRIIRGYGEKFTGDESGDRKYTIEGRDKTCDLIDCSATIKQYKNVSLLDLCNQISSPFGISFRLADASISNEPFASFVIQPGEKAFAALDRAVRQRGVLMIPDGSGGVTLSIAGQNPALTSLIEGVNCKSLGYTLDYSERYSDYVVKGQDTAPQGWTGPATKVEGKATDDGMKRKRQLIIQAEKTLKTSEAIARAAWEAQTRAARSTVVKVQVQGWTQESGVPWLINQTVSMKAPRLGIGGKFLISETEYVQDSGGTVCNLTLLPPDAFLSNPKIKKKKSDQVAKGWSF